MKDYKKVTLSPNSYIVYFKMGVPLMSDRDVCMKVLTTKIDDNTTYLQMCSVENDEFPPVKKVVRSLINGNTLLTTNQD